MFFEILLYCIVSPCLMISSFLVQIKAQKIVSDLNYIRRPLFDTLHGVDPSTVWHFNCDLLVVFIGVVSLYYGYHYVPYFALDYFFINLLRCFSFLMTILPSPSPSHTIRRTHYNNLTLLECLKDQLLLKHSFTYNNDLLFSGHYSFIFLCLFNLSYYGLTNLYSLVGLWMIAFGSSLISIANRKYYTIDVFYAFIVAHYVFMLTKVN